MRIERQEAYREYLKSDDWKTKRSMLLSASDAICCVCFNRSLSNDAHHIYYLQDWRQTKPHHLVCLCRECHENVHKLMKKSRGQLKNPAAHFRKFHEIRDFLTSQIPHAQRMVDEKNLRVSQSRNTNKAGGLRFKWTPQEAQMFALFKSHRALIDILKDRLKDNETDLKKVLDWESLSMELLKKAFGR